MRTSSPLVICSLCALLNTPAFADGLGDTPITSPHSAAPAAHKAASKKTSGGEGKSAATATKDAKPQSEAADKGGVVGTIAAADSRVKAALSATNLDAIKKVVGKSGSFVGTVADIYVGKDNKITKLNFDPDFHKAISATFFASSYAKFPDLKTLKGKKLLVSGKIEEYHGSYEVVVNGTDQVKVVK